MLSGKAHHDRVMRVVVIFPPRRYTGLCLYVHVRLLQGWRMRYVSPARLAENSRQYGRLK